ncbi:hypothetical protein VTO73DRAFT_10959 [Trametes versicolor]
MSRKAQPPFGIRIGTCDLSTSPERPRASRMSLPQCMSGMEMGSLADVIVNTAHRTPSECRGVLCTAHLRDTFVDALGEV